MTESYGGELHFLAEFFGFVDSSSVYENGLFHVFGEVFWFEFFEFAPFCNYFAAVCVLARCLVPKMVKNGYKSDFAY
jgi:hypothetical protein